MKLVFLFTPSLHFSSYSLHLPFYLPPFISPPIDTQTKENMDRSFLIIDPMDFNTFSKCWFEVGIRHPSKLDSPANTTFDPSPSFNSPYISLSNFGNQQPFYMDFNKPSETLESELTAQSLILLHTCNYMYS